ncbi:MAG: hypothetical protein WD904_00085 [Dehalococcoidia bacterium]
MLRLASVCLATLVLALSVVACGDDDGATPSDADATPTISPNGGPITASPAPDPTDDHKTEAPSGSPGDETPGPTAPGQQTPPPASDEGIPAPQVDDAFAAQFNGQTVVPEDCLYNFSEGLVFCPGHGIYAIDPPMGGQDISCNIWIVSEDPKLIQCTSQEPLNTNYYEVPD